MAFLIPYASLWLCVCVSRSLHKRIELLWWLSNGFALSLFLREMKENNGLLREEVEGLQRKLERYEKVQADLVNLELENEVRSQEHLLYK